MKNEQIKNSLTIEGKLTLDTKNVPVVSVYDWVIRDGHTYVAVPIDLNEEVGDKKIESVNGKLCVLIETDKTA